MELSFRVNIGGKEGKIPLIYISQKIETAYSF